MQKSYSIKSSKEAIIAGHENIVAIMASNILRDDEKLAFQQWHRHCGKGDEFKSRDLTITNETCCELSRSEMIRELKRELDVASDGDIEEIATILGMKSQCLSHGLFRVLEV